jgi:RecJ-like exonuclease
VQQSYSVHPDLFDVLIQANLNEFKLPQIRDLLLATKMQNKSKDTVRLFASRHLNEMVEQGLLISTGTRRKKVFRKTELFDQVNVTTAQELDDKIDIDFNNKNSPEQKLYITELGKIRNRLNAELAILIAETDEYRSIMTQFPQTQEKVRKLHEESRQQSATLTGKITAISKTIQLLEAEAA